VRSRRGRRMRRIKFWIGKIREVVRIFVLRHRRYYGFCGVKFGDFFATFWK
jgi:hypothetical protein